jgi:hypothetical protein
LSPILRLARALVLSAALLGLSAGTAAATVGPPSGMRGAPYAGACARQGGSAGVCRRPPRPLPRRVPPAPAPVERRRPCFEGGYARAS